MIPTLQSRLATNPSIPMPKTDEPNVDPLTEANKVVEKHELQLAKAKRLRNDIQREQNKLKNIYPAYVKQYDLRFIKPTYLSTSRPVSKVFSEHKSSSNQVADWARRAVKRPPDKVDLSCVIAELESMNNPQLSLMKKHKVFQLRQIIEAKSYSAALTQMRAHLKLAEMMEYKDMLLLEKDKVIADKDKEISLLKASLEAGKGTDLKENALSLKLLDPTRSNTDIAKAVGLSRSTIATFFNTADIKKQLADRLDSCSDDS